MRREGEREKRGGWEAAERNEGEPDGLTESKTERKESGQYLAAKRITWRTLKCSPKGLAETRSLHECLRRQEEFSRSTVWQRYPRENCPSWLGFLLIFTKAASDITEIVSEKLGYC